ncbi:MAG: lysophospholipid acyltransferase family protein [Elusimicrobiota bacterium]|jgi:KDO2-lipid IV(A) lauroyltransferase|nr:lysophospholipid acyltransferase family protein [Elusimicrobiota bacterium]
MSNRTEFQNYAEYIGLKLLMLVMIILHRPLAQFLGRIAAVLTYSFIPLRKKEVTEGLTIAFPQKSKKEIEKISKATYKNFFSILIDMFFISKMPDEKIEKMLIYDKELIENAMSKNKGLVLMSAHFGNWELSALAFAKKYPVALIVAKQSNNFVDRMMNEFRMKEGFNVIGFQRDDKISFRGIVKALRKNQVLAILADQDAGRDGIFLPFFGKSASTPKGPAFFAIAAGSPIITAFGVPQKDGSMKMKIQDLIVPNTGNTDEDIKTINMIYYQRLEEVIRENPEQWFWFHRRWKTKPPKANK